METIGVFSLSGAAVGGWAVSFAVAAIFAVAFYYLSAASRDYDNRCWAGAFGIIFHLWVAASGTVLLITWWSIPATWSSGGAGFGTAVGALIGTAIVLAGPLVAGRILVPKLLG